MAEKLIRQIRFEIGQIERLLEEYADLVARVQERPADSVEKAALASVLQSFYGGIESMFLRVAKRLDRQAPTGPEWHRELLAEMTRETAIRARVVSPEMAARLRPYLGFRHLEHHIYPFLLDWNLQGPLVAGLRAMWSDVRQELEAFVQSLQASEPE